MRHKFVFVPLGSAGDVNPFIWLARLMMERGYEVSIVIQASMASHAERAGIPFLPAGTVEQQEAVAHNPDIWHPRRAFGLLARHFPIWGREMVPAIRQAVEPGRTVLVGGGIAFGARLVAEADAVPLATVQLQPAIFMSVHDSPVLMAGMERLKRWPLWLRRLVFRLSHLETERHLRRKVNRVRAELGLRQPTRNILSEWALSQDLVVALFPDWFGPPQPDWPKQVVTTRFPLYDEAELRSMGPALETYLGAGAPPVVLTPGSANVHARKFFTAGVEACWQTKKRALLITPFREHLPVSLPAGAAHFDFAPFSRLFPRCAAVVHHGGIGTCAQGLAAGVPQLIMAMAHDQPDNGWRLRNLGVGDYLYPKAFQPATVARRLNYLAGTPAVADACHRASERIRSQMPPQHVAKLLEDFARSRLG